MQKIILRISTVFLFVLTPLNAYSDGLGFDTKEARAAWEEAWKNNPMSGPPDECYRAFTALERLGTKLAYRFFVAPRKIRIPADAAPPLTGLDVPEHFSVPSKSKSDEQRGKLLQLRVQDKKTKESKDSGVVINGKGFPLFKLEYLPSAGVPVAVASAANPVARVFLLHGLGYDISTSFSFMAPGELFVKIAQGGSGDPFATWFANRFPDLKIPLEIVVMDVPPMGWAPSLDKFPSGVDMANYFADVIAELNVHNPLPSFVVGRSASAPLGLIAGQTEAGVIVIGGTFPHPEILDINYHEVKRMERDEGKNPNWDIIRGLMDRFNSLKFYGNLTNASKSKVPILSLVGSEDPETPEKAQKLWSKLIAARGSKPHYRSQHIITGAGHQVYLRPKELAKDQFSDDDPDVRAYYLTLEFLTHNLGGNWETSARK